MGTIYIIWNKISGKIYLGSTVNFKERINRHFRELKKGNHHSIHLQRAYDKYGKGSFEVEIFGQFESEKEKEQNLLDILCLKSETYNISSTSSGGDLISNHPRKKELIENATKVLLDNTKKGPRYKQENPNWKGGKTFCKCGTKINNNSKTCIKCKDQTGEFNPFYGKTHTQESKDKIRRSRLGSYHGSQEKAVLVNGEKFKSVSEAAKKLGVVAGTILYRIKSKNKKFSSYEYES